MGYQVFVFREGKFAGRISPLAMNSREDGASEDFELYRADSFGVTFARYIEPSALCCPSHETFVDFKIEQVDGQPLLVPSNPTTQELHSQ
jgi:LppP/LprE lipoprotein